VIDRCSQVLPIIRRDNQALPYTSDRLALLNVVPKRSVPRVLSLAISMRGVMVEWLNSEVASRVLKLLCYAVSGNES
jgi:hypothetical protein